MKQNINIFTFNPFIQLKPNGYKLGYVNNFLDPSFYNQLAKEALSFVEINLGSWKGTKSADEKSASMEYKTFGGGYQGNSLIHFEKALQDTNATNFLKLIKELSSNKFVEYVYSNLGMSDCPKLVDSSYKMSLFDYFLNRNYVYLNLKLSAYPPNSGIALHRDNQRKVVGMLMYFGFSDGIPRKKGGTQFYSDHIAPDDWSEKEENHKFSQTNMLQLCLDKEPVGNSFCAFEINNRSWHGVESYNDDNQKLLRINLQINFMRIQKKSFLNKIATKLFS